MTQRVQTTARISDSEIAIFPNSDIKTVMDTIDCIDRRILGLLKVRFDLHSEFSHMKQELGLRGDDLTEIQIRTYRNLAADLNLDPDTVETIFRALL